MPSFAKVETAVIAVEPDSVDRTNRPYVLLLGFVALLTAGLVAYAVTLSFTWDEGFHLLAAQLILSGKRPYLDFFHAQTPLYGYWNAGWMWLFGDNWRTPHALSALMSGAATLLAADFVFKRFPVPWRLAGGITAAALTALNVMVVTFGTLGQPYGLCLFLSVAAFRATIPAADRDRWLYAAGAGILAGTSAASSLLTAPLVPVLVVWILWQSQSGDRWRKFAAFFTAAAIPFLPLAWLFAQAPREVLFDVFKWHLVYRHVNWSNETQWDLGVITAWLDSSHGLLLAVLAAVGLLHIAVSNEWDRRRRAEFYLSAWVAAALGIYLASTHPTFTRYFVLMVPFVSIPAAVGLYAIASRVGSARQPLSFAIVLTVLIGTGLARYLHDDRNSYRWSDMEAIARKVDEVTPRAGALWADEHIYFLTRRPPPSGMEFAYSHKLSLPPDTARSLHVISLADIERQVAAQEFDTIATCEEEDDRNKLGLSRLYRRQIEISQCYVFWDRAPR